jgi:hypothetical protein
MLESLEDGDLEKTKLILQNDPAALNNLLNVCLSQTVRFTLLKFRSIAGLSAISLLLAV